jgi:RNA polymerase sigma-B factor
MAAATTARPVHKVRPPQTRANDRRLLVRYRENRDQRTREELVERFMPLAHAVARRYRRSGEPLEDLVQVACVALVKAIDRFDPDRGTSFSTFAVPTIMGEIKRYFRDFGWAAHVPRGMQEEALEVDRAISHLQHELGRSPSVKEIAEHTGREQEEVLDAMEARAAHQYISLDESAPGDEDGDGARVNRISSTEEGYELIEYSASIAPAWKELGEREQRLLHMRFFEELTQAEIAERIGVSQMQVSRLLRSTLERLRRTVETPA